MQIDEIRANRVLSSATCANSISKPVVDGEIVVAHSISRWLAQTEVWQYNQIASLPPEVRSHIVCETVDNIEQFPMPDIRCLSKAKRWRWMINRRLCRTRVKSSSGFLVEQVSDCGARIIHSHFGSKGWADIKAAKHARVKHVVTFYGFDIGFLPEWDNRWYERYRELFAQADLILAEGPNMASLLMEMGCPEQKVCVHHLGVMVDRLPFKPRTKSKNEPLRVLIAASFREKKGITYALEALGRLKHEIPLFITIVGDACPISRSRREKERILAVIEKFGLSNKIRMTGFLPHDRLLKEAYDHHVFLSPSVKSSDGDIEGGAPMTIIEMAATGMPVVGARNCDIPHVIEHGVTGLLADERDVGGLMDQVHRLNDNPDCWMGMVSAARSHIEAEHNARIQGTRLAAIYKRLLADGLDVSAGG